jgi:uncharacterized membrane protein YqiK
MMERVQPMPLFFILVLILGLLLIAIAFFTHGR